ncbi:MAG TPA: plasmid pRiA4b ORF-3 family protein [Rhodopila sp.]|nr:plasmid pRiA4b ORF-3 family protein [Rhodopila sp.]
MPAPSIAILKITLDDVEPAVMRRVAVPADIRLDRLHLAIQAAMGWTNSHLYEFRIGDTGWGEPDPHGFRDGPLLAKKGQLTAVLADAGRKTFHYLYDFGDSWSHTVKLERVTPAVDGEPTIRLIDAVGRCPPEDCGGAPGYEQLLEILGDPEHDEYEEQLEWCGGPFDPLDADRPALERALGELARRWAPRRRAAPKSKA